MVLGEERGLRKRVRQGRSMDRTSVALSEQGSLGYLIGQRDRILDPRPLGRQRRFMLWPCYVTLMAPNTPGEPRGQTRSAGQLPFTELHGFWRSVLLGRSLMALPPLAAPVSWLARVVSR
jgi:hypothetical protein